MMEAAAEGGWKFGMTTLIARIPSGELAGEVTYQFMQNILEEKLEIYL